MHPLERAASVPRVGGGINDVYALSLSGTPEWSRAVVGDASAPSPRAGCAMGYDPWRDRMLIYGGLSFGPVFYDQTWALSLDPPMTWTFLVPTVLPPSGRIPSVNLVDSQGQRWMTSGDGSVWPNLQTETWALDSVAADQATWTRIPPDQNDPQPLTRRGLWAQPAQSRILSYDGWDIYHEADLWTLAQGSADWNLVGGGTLGLVERAGLITFVDSDSQLVYAGLGPDSTLQYRPLDQDVPWVRLAASASTARPTSSFPIGASCRSKAYSPIPATARCSWPSRWPVLARRHSICSTSPVGG